MRNKAILFVAVMLGIALLSYFGLNARATETDQQLVEKVNNAIALNNANLEKPILRDINTLVRRGNKQVKRQKAIDALVVSGANCLDEHADWVDRSRGRQIYNILGKIDGNLVVDALVRQVLKSNDRLRVLFLGVKLGINGSQERLNGVLMKHGDKRMAEDFLNSGSQELYQGGRSWANSHGYYISTGMGSHRVAWGSF